MIRVVGSAQMADGTTIQLEAGQSEFAAWERFALRHGYPAEFDRAPKVSMIRFLGYAAGNCGIPPADWPPFEVWDMEVLEVDMTSAEGLPDASVPPTPAVRSVE